MTNTQAYLTTGVLVAGTWVASELGGAGGFMLFAVAACIGFMLVAWRKGELKVRKLGQGDAIGQQALGATAAGSGGFPGVEHITPIEPPPERLLSDRLWDRTDPFYCGEK